MKNTYISPSFEIVVFKTEDVLEASNAGGVIIAPPKPGGGEVEVGDVSLF